MKKLLLAVSLAASAGLMQGCVAVPLIDSSTVARAYEFSDSISVKSEAVANSLTAAGYTTKASSRQRGL